MRSKRLVTREFRSLSSAATNHYSLHRLEHFIRLKSPSISPVRARLTGETLSKLAWRLKLDGLSISSAAALVVKNGEDALPPVAPTGAWIDNRSVQ